MAEADDEYRDAVTDMNCSSAYDLTFRRPDWAQGAIKEDDARFIRDVVLETRSSTALEIGVASGCSSVALLQALAHVNRGGDRTVLLHAFDVADRCYFDEQIPTGAAVAELVPDLASRYCLHIGNALSARDVLPLGSVPLAFIDGNHFHPWPTLDLMALLPLLAPGAWVLLHDVRLPSIRARSLRSNGPGYLFDRWPFEKRSGGSHGNTGAIQMAAGARALDSLWTTLLDLPWNTEPPTAVLEALGVTARPMPPTLARALRAAERAAAEDRPLYVWGTGTAGRNLAGWLGARGATVAALVEDVVTSPGTPLEGLDVVTPDQVRGACRSPLVLVSGGFCRTVAGRLSAAGWIKGTDFVVLE